MYRRGGVPISLFSGLDIRRRERCPKVARQLQLHPQRVPLFPAIPALQAPLEQAVSRTRGCKVGHFDRTPRLVDALRFQHQIDQIEVRLNQAGIELNRRSEPLFSCA